MFRTAERFVRDMKRDTDGRSQRTRAQTREDDREREAEAEIRDAQRYFRTARWTSG